LTRAKAFATSAAVTGCFTAANAALTVLTRSDNVFGHGSLWRRLRVEGWDAESGLLGLGAFGVLVFGRKPAHQPCRFLFGPLGVQSDHAFEDFSVRQPRRPAVAGEHGGVEVIVGPALRLDRQANGYSSPWTRNPRSPKIPILCASGLPNCKSFGRRIRAARAALELSQEELAFESSIDRSYIRGVERGERNLTFKVLCKIARALRCGEAALKREGRKRNI
jgi:DNA-binding XRE family transcriptional regulator